MPKFTSDDSIDTFLLKKGEEYPENCFNPRIDMHSSFLFRSGKKSKSSSNNASGGGGRKIGKVYTSHR